MQPCLVNLRTFSPKCQLVDVYQNNCILGSLLKAWPGIWVYVIKSKWRAARNIRLFCTRSISTVCWRVFNSRLNGMVLVCQLRLKLENVIWWIGTVRIFSLSCLNGTVIYFIRFPRDLFVSSIVYCTRELRSSSRISPVICWRRKKVIYQFELLSQNIWNLILFPSLLELFKTTSYRHLLLLGCRKSLQWWKRFLFVSSNVWLCPGCWFFIRFSDLLIGNFLL